MRDADALEQRPRSLRVLTRAAVRRLLALALVLAAICLLGYFTMIRMPGSSFRGPLPPLTVEQAALSDRLRSDVIELAGTIGPRNIDRHGDGLRRAAAWIERRLTELGYAVERQTFEARDGPCDNLIVEIAGTTRGEEIVVVGAHYDTCGDTPGADDNASGVAGVLALAEAFAGSRLLRTLRLVLFANEEPPHFQTPDMGSLQYAMRCRERADRVVGMLSLEMLGTYRDTPGSQHYPPILSLFYPTTADFIAFVGNFRSRRLVRDCIGTFRANAAFPSEGAAPPGWLQGIGWSDHWAFWQAGYPGIMVTDTAMFRYAHYHGRGDVPDELDYERMARVVAGVEVVVRSLTSTGS